MPYGMLLTATGLQLDTITTAGTALLTWMLTSFGSIFKFFLENPGLFLWLVASLIGMVFVFFKKLI